MAIADSRLQKIVSLKRRAAESQFRSIAKLVDEIDRQILVNEQKLNENNSEGVTAFSGDMLAAERFTQKLLLNLKSLEQKRADLEPEFKRARFELQKIIVSEEVLEGE